MDKHRPTAAACRLSTEKLAPPACTCTGSAQHHVSVHTLRLSLMRSARQHLCPGQAQTAGQARARMQARCKGVGQGSFLHASCAAGRHASCRRVRNTLTHSAPTHVAASVLSPQGSCPATLAMHADTPVRSAAAASAICNLEEGGSSDTSVSSSSASPSLRHT